MQAMGESSCCGRALLRPKFWSGLLATIDFRRVGFIAVLFGGLVGMAYWAVSDFYGGPYFQVVGVSLVVSRTTAYLMLPVFSLCILAVCRRTMTFLRSTPLNWVIPFDDAISFHQWMGIIGTITAAIHSVSHIANFIFAKREVTHSTAALGYAGAFAGYIWNPSVTATGCLMILGMLVALPFALKLPKQAKWLKDTPPGRVLNDFTNFYITHQIFFLTFTILFILHPIPGLSHVHGRRTYLPVTYSWMWIAWPFLLYLGERLYGLFRAETWDTQVVGASILDPGVLTLELTKPPGFTYKPGQYVFIQCRDISHYEWHPFSLTSAPADNFLQLHINNAGDWTGALHARFVAAMQLARADKGALMQRLSQSMAARQSLKGGLSLKQQLSIRPSVKAPNMNQPATIPEAKPITGSAADAGVDRGENLMTNDSAQGFRTGGPRNTEKLQASLDSPFGAPGVLASPYDYTIPEDRTGQVIFADSAQPGGHAPSQLDAEMAGLISEGVVGERPSGKMSLMTDRISSQFVIPEDAPPEEARQQLGSAGGSQLLAPVPSGSYIAFSQSKELGSGLQKMQRLRSKVSQAAWQGLPTPNPVRSLPARMSSRRFRRLDSVLKRFGNASFSAPAEAPRIILDGPFGAPAQEHSSFRTIVLIGMGIGITPMLSIMRDTLHNLAALPRNPTGLEAEGKAAVAEKRRAYMHWVVRDPRAGGWLKSEFEIMGLLDATGDMFRSHVHVTGQRMPETRSSAIWKPDPVMQSNVELTNGRPDFEAILKDIQAEVGRARVGVFLCGPLPVQRLVSKACARLSQSGDATFVFHAEHF
ncbi:hypothetical protein CVIRNUC_000986 [Coccomyxa viridis]|uniref:FAD-binding FR-type domain-containing protein n=1 Tax=Coccomyxa viridis TaxID=1274662 RepID=A0AAV1HSR7_9CHLO|nr:hypothetical protein CVIRNUC_000986 [Coccomyxa viridis]